MSEDAHLLFDRALFVERLARARKAEPNALTTTIAEELAERLDLVTRRFDKTLVIAAEPEPVAARLLQSAKIGSAVAQRPAADEVIEAAPQSLDAIFSVLELQSANDVPGLLIQMRRALKPDGLLLACLFAGDTLSELRQSWLAAEAQAASGATPRVAPMIGVRELGALLQRAGFALPVADLDRTVVRYGDAIALIHEIGELGYANHLAGRTRNFVTRRLLGAAVQHYHDRFSDDDGRVRATLDIAWLTGWAPHDSQQKPLQPGSAKARLADALKVPEQKV